MEYSLSSAAKATGSSKSLIHRMCEDGRLSHRKLPNGQYRIDASELGRAFSEKNHVTVPEPLRLEVEPIGRKSGTEVTTLRMELTAVQTKAQMLEEQLGREREDRERERETHRETVDDLRRRLDREQEERRSLQRQLTPPAHPVPQAAQERPVEAPAKVEAKPSRGLLARLFGLGSAQAGA